MLTKDEDQGISQDEAELAEMEDVGGLRTADGVDYAMFMMAFADMFETRAKAPQANSYLAPPHWCNCHQH